MAGPDGSISISHGDIETQSKNLADLKNELERLLQFTMTQIQQLQDGGAFQGLAGASFNQLYTDYNTSSLKTVAILEDFGNHLSKTSQAFAEVDSAYTLK